MNDEARIEKLLNRIPEKHLHTILPIIAGFENDTIDFNRIHIRKSLKAPLPYIIGIYLCILLSGFLANIWMSGSIFRVLRNESISKSLKGTYRYMLVNSVNDAFVKCIVVLPFSLVILVALHWTFGSVWCHSFPLFQDASFYWTSVHFVILFYNRYKMSSHVGSEAIVAPELFEETHGLPAFWGSLLAIIIATMGVIPYTVYIEYIDISPLLRQFQGTGFCVVNLSGNITDYIRVLFIGFYVVPVALSLSFYYRTSPTISSWTSAPSRPKHNRGLANAIPRVMGRTQRELGSGEQSLVEVRCARNSSTNALESEKRIQKMLMTMFVIHSACLLPINILRISKHLIVETHQNSFTFDVLFVTFVGIQFLSVSGTPLCYFLMRHPCGQNYSPFDHGYELNGSPSSDENALQIPTIDEETVCSELHSPNAMY